MQICCSCGGGAPVDVHFCPQCTRILTLGRQGDYFAFMSLPRKLHIDMADLERRFRELSRQFHPDYFYNATPAERHRMAVHDTHRDVVQHAIAHIDGIREPHQPTRGGIPARAVQEHLLAPDTGGRIVTGGRQRRHPARRR